MLPTSTYNKRNIILEELGFTDYQEYLKSNLWKSIRAKVLPSKCCCCRKKASQVHHSKYTFENLSGKSIEHLHPICLGCHQKIEFTKKGIKRSLHDAEKARRKLAKSKKPNLPRKRNPWPLHKTPGSKKLARKLADASAEFARKKKTRKRKRTQSPSIKPTKSKHPTPTNPLREKVRNLLQ